MKAPPLSQIPLWQNGIPCMEWTPDRGWALSTIDVEQVIQAEVEARTTPCHRRHEGDPVVTPQDEQAILKHALNDHSPEWICQAMPGIKPAAVREVLETYGWPDHKKMQWGLDELGGVAPYRAPGRVKLAEAPAANRFASQLKASPPAATVVQVPAAPVGWSAVLTRALASKRPATRAEAARVEKRLQALADRLAQDDQVEAAKVRAAHEKQQALDDVKAARAALDAALAKVRGTKPKRPMTPQQSAASAANARKALATNAQRMAALGVQTATVRAWAKQAGVPCPDRGVLPTNVLDAYVDAHLE